MADNRQDDGVGVWGQLTPVISTLSHAKDNGGKAAGTQPGAHDNTARPPA
jgi:hypothetical protein